MNEVPAAKPRIAVVFGGRSPEHAVSCATAASVMQAIDADLYDVLPIGITRDGRWVLESDETSRLRLDANHVPHVDGSRSPVVLNSGSVSVFEPGSPPRALGQVDVVFPVLHGPWGEDGTIQGLFEMAGIRYVGSGVLASAVGMDKHYMKVALASACLPVLPYTVVSPLQWETDKAACRESVAALGYPVFVKPARGGSSLGISRVDRPELLDDAIEAARQFDPKVLVERAAIGMREVECGVLQRPGGGADASVPAEIIAYGAHEFYDFEAKYLGEEGVVLEVPASLPPGVEEEVKQMSVAAFTALGCEGLARVDFFLAQDGELMVNEINTMPGFTPSSMYPRMWAESGVSYPDLVDRLIALAMSRQTGLR